MLAIVSRPSIDSPRMAAPVYSTTWPAAPSVPIWAIVPRIMSLAVQPGAELARRSRSASSAAAAAAASGWPARARPRSCRCRTRARRRRRAWTCASRRRRSSCPAASGPSSGPITCTMPLRRWPSGYRRTPNSAQLRVERRRAAPGESSSGSPGPVATLWSAVATVRSGRRTRRPAARSPSNACGLVTSCTRCRSTKSRSSPITWSSQTFSNMVRGAAAMVGISVPSA